ncbi:hypothetical protein [Salinibaculum salinum]|uniref:hypothetical protein n=1 Tax=Salinibaculum salinum TaxID=3131996 RepID=UPI0030EF9223
MSATVFLEEPLGEHEQRIDCEEVKIIGDLAWASSEDQSQEIVLPLSNVSGVTGGSVKQEIEAIEAPGGRFTELVTDIS